MAIPDTVLEEQESLREKTVKIGQIARICSVFGVESIQVFRDPRGKGESALIKRVLEYLETPQYLRRRLFPLDESLKFAGLLPPLRIPSHKPKVSLNRLQIGEFRDGLVLADGRAVDVGLEKPLIMRQELGNERRITVKITSVMPLEGIVVDRSQTGEYWGYEVEVKSADEVLSNSRYGTRIATSRLGDPISSRVGDLRARLAGPKGVLLLFGSPSRGLFVMMRNLRQRVDFVLNLYPEQHSVTVRTEEAMSSGLYLLEILDALGNTKV